MNLGSSIQNSNVKLLKSFHFDKTRYLLARIQEIFYTSLLLIKVFINNHNTTQQCLSTLAA